MTRAIKLFRIGLRQILRDGMLFALIPAPFAIGCVFKLAVPAAGRIAEELLSFQLAPWHGLVDGLFACLTPMFAAMASAFMLLEERDEGIGAFYQITPAGGYPYLAARVGIPMAWAFVSTLAALALFNVSGLSFPAILSASALSAFAGMPLAMLVVSFADNRVEGLALSKMMGLSLLGLAFAWLVPAPYKFIGAAFPSFWVGRLAMGGASLLPSFAAGTLACFTWTAPLTKRFLSRI
jgi:fluoroquinolone transport system permease protein